MKVLWLASWYPDELKPMLGDFVQRHAKAVAQLMPFDLIHVAQAGKDFDYLDKIVINNDNNLHEAIHYFYFKKTGITWLDKISYNKTYLNYYKKVIYQYIKEKGKPDLIHVHVPMKAGIIALNFLKKLNIPYIVSEHSSLYVKQAEHNFYKRSFYFKYHTKKIFKHAALVTNVSANISNVLKTMFGLQDVRIIPNVVDTKYFYLKPKEKNKVFRWLHVSSMQPLKNVDKIIQSFKNISGVRDDWELIVCGPINQQYKQLVDQLNLQSKIKFTGEIRYQDVAKKMKQADAFILFSRHENFPCVVIEALCCGLPVVASDVGGIAEAVNESNGVLVEPNSINDLQKAIISMMDNSFQYNHKKIAEEAASKYNYATVAKQFILIYNEVINHQSQRFNQPVN